MSSRCRALVLSLAIAFSFLFVVGCGSSSSPSSTAQLRILNASPQQQSINLLLDNNTIENGIVSQSASAYIAQPAGNHTVQIEANNSTTALVTQSVTLNSGSYHTILAVEPSFASSSLTMSLLTDDNSAPASGSFKLRIINASPDFGNLDAYITVPGQQVISVDSGPMTFSSGQVRTLVLLDNFGSGFTSALLADLN